MTRLRRTATAASLLLAGALLGGCTIITVAGTAASLAVTAGSLAVDAAVGTVKVTGAVVGAAADVVLPSSDKKE